MRIDADPADDRLDPDTGCPIPPMPTAEALEDEAALADYWAMCDAVDAMDFGEPQGRPF